MDKHSWEIKYKGYNTRDIEGRPVTLPAIKTLSVTADYEVGFVEIPEKNCFIGEVITPKDFEKKLLICDIEDKHVRDALLEKFYNQYKELLIAKAKNDPIEIEKIETNMANKLADEIARLDVKHGQNLTSEC